MQAKRPLGFGDTKQVAEFFGVTEEEVTQLALTGEWPSYVLSGRRVFDVDYLVKSLVRAPGGEEVTASA